MQTTEWAYPLSDAPLHACYSYAVPGHQQPLEMLLSRYADSFDCSAGARLLEELARRSATTPVSTSLTGEILGRHLPLHGFRSLMAQLVPQLATMMLNSLELHNAQDHHMHGQHILQLVAAPGMGKTTAATAMWAVLHYLCSTQDQLVVQGLRGVQGVERILQSFSPKKFLVFYLSFDEGEYLWQSQEPPRSLHLCLTLCHTRVCENKRLQL